MASKLIMQQSAGYARKVHILTLLKSGEAVSLQTIINSLNNLTLTDGTRLDCGEKTVKRDVKELKDMGAKIHWFRALDGYKLEDLSWEIPSSPLLGSDELLALSVGAQLAESSLPKTIAAHVHVLAEGIFKTNSGGFYHGADVSTMKILVPPLGEEGEKIFSNIYKAWSERRLLTIKYADEQGRDTVRTIEPQLLLFSGTTWYIRAYCYLRQEARTFAIPRVEYARLLDNTFAPRPDVCSGIQFDNFDDRDPYTDIVIRLTRYGRQFAVAHVLHSKQQITEQADGSYLLTIPRMTKHLVEQWIMSQRGHAVPLAPAELVQKVHEVAKQISDACQVSEE